MRRLPVREDILKRFFGDRRGATAIEYGLIAALIALAAASALPNVVHEITATMVRSREGLKGKICQGDPTDAGIQCN
jgi:pilus assembly protein Flp/PilA